jgi:hypothetical protein
MPSFKRQIERKVSAQAAIRQIKTFCRKIGGVYEPWSLCPIDRPPTPAPSEPFAPYLTHPDCFMILRESQIRTIS